MNQQMNEPMNFFYFPRQRLLVPNELFCLWTRASVCPGTLCDLRSRLEDALCVRRPEGGPALQRAVRPKYPDLEVEAYYCGFVPSY